MNPFIVFEINDPSQVEAIKGALSPLGYYSAWVSSGVRYEFPSNCVWKVNSELQSALTDLQNVIAVLNQTRTDNPIRLLKCVILSNTPWVSIPNVTTPA